MIYVTGDTHGDFSRFSKKELGRNGIKLTAGDSVIVCGDFGLCWERNRTFAYHCKNFAQKPYTVLWIQGNHENYDMIAEFPLEEWHGGKVRHIVRDKVILLERGQVFEMDGKSFFTFGGASSHDIQGGVLDPNAEDFKEAYQKARKGGLPFRILHQSWWPQELPNEDEMREGIRNLEKVNYQVDYVLTHCCSSSMQRVLDSLPPFIFDSDILTEYLQSMEERLEFRHWFFGHYHSDLRVDSKHTLLYEELLELA